MLLWFALPSFISKEKNNKEERKYLLFFPNETLKTKYIENIYVNKYI